MLSFILLVLIGGLIGWATNKIAIKMLFRPINPHKILGITFHGIFPRRKDQIAASLSNIIETELLSKDVIMDQLFETEKLDILKNKLKVVLVDKLVGAIPPMAAMFLGGDVKGFVGKYIDQHSDEIFEQLINEFRTIGLENLDIYELVKTRLDALDFEEFEKIMVGLMSKELRFIEIIGLVIGGIIGAIQYLIVLFL